jgi:hypothetical protein
MPANVKWQLGLSFALVALVFGSCKCEKSSEPGAATSPSTASSSSASPAASLQITSVLTAAPKGAPWNGVPSATAISLPNMPIPERFQYEKETRPADGRPRVEEVWSALEKAGLILVDKKQHLAAPFGARYCEGARAVQEDKTTTLLQLSVCEYISADLAKSAGEFSEQSMKQLMPTRRVHSNKRAALVMRPEQDKPEHQRAAETAVTTFKAL